MRFEGCTCKLNSLKKINTLTQYEKNQKEYEDYGTIEYDDNQGTGVVWIKELGDVITYCATLKETEKYLSEELHGREKLIQQHLI